MGRCTWVAATWRPAGIGLVILMAAFAVGAIAWAAAADLKAATFGIYMRQVVLGHFTGALLQYHYAKCFKGLSESQIDQTLQSFKFSHCIVNKGLAETLKRRMAR